MGGSCCHPRADFGVWGIPRGLGGAPCVWGAGPLPWSFGVPVQLPREEGVTVGRRGPMDAHLSRKLHCPRARRSCGHRWVERTDGVAQQVDGRYRDGGPTCPRQTPRECSGLGRLGVAKGQAARAHRLGSPCVTTPHTSTFSLSPALGKDLLGLVPQTGWGWDRNRVLCRLTRSGWHRALAAPQELSPSWGQQC